MFYRLRAIERPRVAQELIRLASFSIYAAADDARHDAAYHAFYDADDDDACRAASPPRRLR